jgi:hypothetical protein
MRTLEITYKNPAAVCEYLGDFESIKLPSAKCCRHGAEDGLGIWQVQFRVYKRMSGMNVSDMWGVLQRLWLDQGVLVEKQEGVAGWVERDGLPFGKDDGKKFDQPLNMIDNRMAALKGVSKVTVGAWTKEHVAGKKEWDAVRKTTAKERRMIRKRVIRDLFPDRRRTYKQWVAESLTDWWHGDKEEKVQWEEVDVEVLDMDDSQDGLDPFAPPEDIGSDDEGGAGDEADFDNMEDAAGDGDDSD